MKTVLVKPGSADQPHPALTAVTPSWLHETVTALSYPRHYVSDHQANMRARDWLATRFSNIGLDVDLQGKYDNVIADRGTGEAAMFPLLGAHYDTVATTSGADDNNSAIAVCMEAARVLAEHTNIPYRIAIFNREEEGLLGSSEYVEALTAPERRRVAEAHIFEMVGYFTNEPSSQGKPVGLPVSLPDKGDFIGLLSNSESNKIADQVHAAVKQAGGNTPLLSLKIYLGAEKAFGDLLRSDHTPFWAAGMPALMWTDTSNFRNPHYHAQTDLPHTLDYMAMADVTRMIVAHLIRQYGD